MVRAKNGSGSDKIYGYAGGLFNTNTTYRKGILKWNNALPSSPTVLYTENFSSDEDYRTVWFGVHGPELSLWMGNGVNDSANTLIARVNDSDIFEANNPGLIFELDNTGNNIRIRGSGGGKFPYIVTDLPINHLQRSKLRTQRLVEEARCRAQQLQAAELALWR